MKSCAIVGGGIGGLSAALLLARYGYRVEIFEQQQQVGGKAASTSLDGFRFDMGPTLFTMPFVLEELFSAAGKNLSDYMELKLLEETTRYFYSDGTRFKAYSDMKRYYSEAKAAFSDPLQRISRYFSYCKTIYDLTADIFMFSPFHEWKDMITDRDKWAKIFEMYKMDPLRSMHRANKWFFKDPKLLQLMDRFATFNGSSPYRVPATLNIIAHVEHMGAYVPTEGIRRIPEALAEAASEEGAVIHLGTPVSAINYTKNGVTGIRTGGKDYAFDLVVSNSDVTNTYITLLRQPDILPAVKYRMLKPSTSALVFYWGVKGSYPELATHNILFSEVYRKEFRDLIRREICPEDPSVYIYISSRFNPGDAPRGHENWYVMINAPYRVNQNWHEEIEKSRIRILEKIGHYLSIDIRKNIVTEEVLTPPDIERRTHSRSGSIYGISSNNTVAAFLRQRNRSKRFKGLYFCGGSAAPGGGIPLAMLSGKMTAELIRRFEGGAEG